MLRWYIFRKGNDFKVGHVNEVGADFMRQMGWELAAQPFDSREEAEKHRQDWQERCNRPQLDAETEQRLAEHFGRPLTGEERQAFALAERVCGKMALLRGKD